MKIYNYDKNGIYLYSNEADESPLEPGIFLIPANATEQEPPKTIVNQVAVFNGVKWDIKNYYIGQSACEIDLNGFFIKKHIFVLGEKPNTTIVLANVPDANIYKPKWDGTEWVQGEDKPIDGVRQNKINELNLYCTSFIVAGFHSTAYQNVDKIYGSTIEDQANITGNALAAVSKINNTAGCENDLFYYHALGEDFVEWTAEEVLQLARDFRSFKENILFRNKQLQTYINTLNTEVDVEKVNWDTQI